MDHPGFLTRLALAFGLFFRLLADAALAARVQRALSRAAEAPTPEALPAPAAKPAPKPAAEPKPAPVDPAAGAVALLGALQREGRFVDFVTEDLGPGVTDADLVAAARLVHDGCAKVLRGWLTLEPVWPGAEGARVTVEAGFDARRVLLTGRVEGDPPFSGVLAHHGWRVAEARLPARTSAADPTIIAPAEVEL